jgi:alkanesulfonate monooxygenase
LGITHFIISDAPYLRECARIGDELLPRLRTSLSPAPAVGATSTAARGER